MKTYFSNNLVILQVFGLLSHSYGQLAEEGQVPVASSNPAQSLRRGLFSGCSGTPTTSDCGKLNRNDCGRVQGCAWTTQHGNKCWGQVMDCNWFNKPGHGESWCNKQPGCSWNGGASAQLNGPAGCFSGDTTVEVKKDQEITTKKMKEVQVGDLVKVGGRNTYEPVYAFGHNDSENHIDYIKLSLDKRSSIELSKEHLIYANGKVVRADTVKVGDVLTKDGTSSPVTKISKIHNKKGMYAPLTASGTIVVNGVLASSYVAIQSEANSGTEEIKVHGMTLPFVDQNMGIHLAISPLRIACTVTGSSLGVCKGDYNDSDGFNPYVAWGMDMVAWGEQQPALVQVVLLSGAIMTFLLLNLFESAVLGSGPLVLRLAMFVAFGYAFGWYTFKDASQKKKVV